MLMVQKYGGTSVADPDKLQSAARRAVDLVRQGIRVVMVVSAQGDTTDRMIRDAKLVNRRGSAREMDAYLSAGEQMAAPLLAMAIGALGHSAISLNAAQAMIHTDNTYGNAEILRIDPRRIEDELDAGNIVVITGFQGLAENGDITTLGRGGSDTTAVALAACLHADRCQIYTDVDGIYDRDPRLHPDARRFSRIGYREMLTLARNGAQVLHHRSITLAQTHNIPIEVLSAATNTPGTIVG